MRVVSLSLALTLSVLPTVARAFSDPALYGESTLSGGGGGRYFTGSPGDSFTCAVCHTGAAEPAISIEGLPWGGLSAGKTYDVSVSWTDPEISHALTLEILDSVGKPVSISLPDPKSVDADGRCDQDKNGDVAAFLMKEGKRQIVGVTDCHPASLRFRFKAPSDAPIQVYVSAVRSDSSSTPDGDGVSSQALTVPSTGAATSAAATSCQISSVPAGHTPGLSTLIACMSILVSSQLRARRRRRAQRTSQ